MRCLSSDKREPSLLVQVLQKIKIKNKIPESKTEEATSPAIPGHSQNSRVRALRRRRLREGRPGKPRTDFPAAPSRPALRDRLL